MLNSIYLLSISFLFGLFFFLYGILNLFFKTNKKSTIAFFHPYCDNGGGGERVLWMIIEALFKASPTVLSKDIVIYSGDIGVSKDQILENVKSKFGISFSIEQEARITIVYIQSRFLLEPKWYPIGTMIFQSIASIIVALECIISRKPDYYIDTIGAPFSYPVVKWLTKAKIAAYVHYPLISTDMLNKVREQRPSYNNNERIATNSVVSSAKLEYYKFYAAWYNFVGSFSDLVLVNSTWTQNHILKLWPVIDRLKLVFPPCNTSAMQQWPVKQRDINFEKDQMIILSIGQFRPEKDHLLQLRIMKIIKAQSDSIPWLKNVHLVMMGSVRNKDDSDLVKGLEEYIAKEELENFVTILQNRPYSEILRRLEASHIGLHTMWNEHFGISVVELLAAGLVVVAHNSGGPKSDIIQPNITGFLAVTEEEYASKIISALENYSNHLTLRENARLQAQKFSDEIFCQEIQVEFNKFFES